MYFSPKHTPAQINVCTTLMYINLQNKYEICIKRAIIIYGQMIKMYQSTKYLNHVTTKI